MVAQTRVLAMGVVRYSWILDILGRWSQQTEWIQRLKRHQGESHCSEWQEG